jgi:hypothetical protein
VASLVLLGFAPDANHRESPRMTRESGLPTIAERYAVFDAHVTD